MTRVVALLRGINVGGHRVKMAVLREIVEGLGFSRVETLIASGNLVLDPGVHDPATVESRLETGLQAALGYAVATFVRGTAELQHCTTVAPFAAEEIAGHTVYVGFLKDAPTPESAAAVAALGDVDNDLRCDGRELYWLCRSRLSDTKIAGPALERALGRRPTTLRNLTTVSKLAGYGP
jgi:uncharacterized protein (DUF1697 family)